MKVYDEEITTTIYTLKLNFGEIQSLRLIVRDFLDANRPYESALALAQEILNKTKL